MVTTGIVESSYGLSALQHGMLFQSLYAQQSGVYIQQLVCRLRHELNVPAFTRAWQRVVDRHAVLRTGFHWQGLQGPIQQVHSNLTLSIEEQDWRDLSVRESEARLDEYLQVDRRRGFELNEPPLIRLALFRIADADHTFVWTSHHALLDGRSRLLILKEVFALYEAFCQQRDLELRDLKLPDLKSQEPLPFKDYIDELQQQDLVQAEAFWRDALKGFIAPTPLIGARTSSQLARWGHAEHRFQLTEAETSALKALAYQQELTLNTLIQGAWALLLSRYAGSDDVVFGLTKSCRSKSAASTVGLLINTLPVRVSVNPETSLLAYLKNLRAFNIALRDHQHTPLVRIREWSELPATSPVFESLVVFESYELNATLRGQGGDWEKREFQLLERTNYPLVLSGCVHAALSMKLAYDCSRFDDAAIKRMAGHFRTLLTGFVDCLEQPVGKLALLTAPEIEQLSQWNRTEKEYPKDRCIHELFEAQAARTPAAEALVCGAERLSYKELNERANQLAHYLRSRGVGPETRVGICVERSVAMVVGLLGILKAGAAYVPLDPQYPQQRLSFMIADAEVSILLTQDSVLEKLSELKRDNVICLDRDWSLIAEQGRENPLVEVSPANLAYIIYTSGSSGQPKGVAIAHRSTMALLYWALDRFSIVDLSAVLASTSICFDISIFELFAPLACGGAVVLVRNVLEVKELSPAQRIKLINTVPSALAELLRGGELPSSIEVVNLAGEALSGKLAQAAYEQKGVREVNNLYGPSEDTTYSTCAIVRRDEREEPTIGRPITNTQAYILDRALEVVPVGVTGEIYLGGAGLARGYWQRPDLTADRFIPHPHSAVAGARLYRSGDLARYLPDGEIDFLGRADEQVKLRGFRIELGEIESVLAQHPAVAECVVVARFDDDEKDQRLVCYLVSAAEQRPDVSELRRHLSERLPDYMLPAQFVWLAEMPLTPNGKVNRKALPRPERTRPELEAAYVAPRTRDEEVLADIFQQVLKLERVGIHDNFFTLGGHSLLATQVVSLVSESFNVELPLMVLFNTATVAGLASRIKENAAVAHAGNVQVVKAESRQPQPLSFAQQRIWFLDQLVPGGTAYNSPAGVRLEGVLDRSAFERSLSEIVRRHESLRTSFAMKNDEPVQIISPAQPVKMSVFDLSHLPAEERATECRLLAEQLALQPFDLRTGPLLRVSLLRLAEEEHLLVLAMHHIITDGWSNGILLRELKDIYEAYTEGKSSPLADLTIQYADFAGWQRRWLTGNVLAKQLAYWKEQLQGAPPVLELPLDHPRPPVQSQRGFRLTRILPASLSTSLKRLSQQEGVTLFMTLLAAFQTLLYRYSYQQDFCVGVDIANRTRTQVEPLIGFFVNMLVLRADLSANPTFRELLSRVREVCVGAYAHQDLPFEKLVEELEPDRALSHKPLFQVAMSLQNMTAMEMQLKDLRLEIVEFETPTAKCDLTLMMKDSAAGLSAMMVYDTELFERETIERMLGHLEVVLETMTRDAEQRVGDIQLLTAAEQAQLEQWNQTALEYPADKCVHELFAAQAGRTPEALAVESGAAQLTYQQLDERANQLAHHLQALGVGAETRVGLCVTKSVEMVIAMLATLKAGAAYVPLDPEYPRERLAFMIADADVAVLLTQESLLAGLPDSQAQLICLDRNWPLIAPHSNVTPPSPATPANLAYIIYTSGSSGLPKGVVVSHESLCNLVTWNQHAYQLGPHTRASQVASFSFDAAVWEIWSCLCSGASLHLPDDATRMSPEALRDWLVRKQITQTFLPTSLGESVLELGDTEIGEVRRMLVGGDRLRRRPSSTASYELNNLYGPTENTVITTAATVESKAAGRGAPAIGRPIANVQVYVLDAGLRVVPAGVNGEMYVGGANLARGYWKRAELTAEKFIPHPFSSNGGERLYRTGDIVKYRADGEIEFIGRADEQVKVRGYRIELGEIESVLNRHPSVQEAVVVVRTESDENRLVAYVVGAPEQSPSHDELRSHLFESVPGYMVPAIFVLLDEMPLTPSGKVDRQALPAPDHARQQLDEAVSPRSEDEAVLAGIFEQVLKVDQVGIHDNFFTLGGHSLLATQVVSRIRQHFNLDVPLTAVFKAPTVAALSVLIEELIISEVTTVNDPEPDWVLP